MCAVALYLFSRTETSKSRLVREDDNDASDEEECIQMSVDTAKRDLNRWRDAFNSGNYCKKQAWESFLGSVNPYQPKVFREKCSLREIRRIFTIKLRNFKL